MTKKDYELIANTLNGRYLALKHEHKNLNDFTSVVSDLCQAFEMANGRFDKLKFLSAVYTED